MLRLSTLAAAFTLAASLVAANDPRLYDLVVYGQTSAGVIAAVQSERMGKSAVLVGPGQHLGGLSSGGLGYTDIGNKQAIGGLAREFYERVGAHYGKEEMWVFEPHVAERVFDELVTEHKVEVHRDEWLDRSPGAGVTLEGGRFVSHPCHRGQPRCWCARPWPSPLRSRQKICPGFGCRSKLGGGWLITSDD